LADCFNTTIINYAETDHPCDKFVFIVITKCTKKRQAVENDMWNDTDLLFTKRICLSWRRL